MLRTFFWLQAIILAKWQALLIHIRLFSSYHDSPPTTWSWCQLIFEILYARGRIERKRGFAWRQESNFAAKMISFSSTGFSIYIYIYTHCLEPMDPRKTPWLCWKAPLKCQSFFSSTIGSWHQLAIWLTFILHNRHIAPAKCTDKCCVKKIDGGRIPAMFHY